MDIRQRQDKDVLSKGLRFLAHLGTESLDARQHRTIPLRTVSERTFVALLVLSLSCPCLVLVLYCLCVLTVAAGS
jgi:hypothetical protein